MKWWVWLWVCVWSVASSSSSSSWNWSGRTLLTASSDSFFVSAGNVSTWQPTHAVNSKYYFDDPLNWSPNVVPGINDTAIVSTNYGTSLTPPPYFRQSLTLLSNLSILASTNSQTANPLTVQFSGDESQTAGVTPILVVGNFTYFIGDHIARSGGLQLINLQLNVSGTAWIGVATDCLSTTCTAVDTTVQPMTSDAAFNIMNGATLIVDTRSSSTLVTVWLGPNNSPCYGGSTCGPVNIDGSTLFYSPVTFSTPVVFGMSSTFLVNYATILSSASFNGTVLIATGQTLSLKSAQPATLIFAPSASITSLSLSATLLIDALATFFIDPLSTWNVSSYNIQGTPSPSLTLTQSLPITSLTVSIIHGSTILMFSSPLNITTFIFYYGTVHFAGVNATYIVSAQFTPCSTVKVGVGNLLDISNLAIVPGTPFAGNSAACGSGLASYSSVYWMASTQVANIQLSQLMLHNANLVYMTRTTTTALFAYYIQTMYVQNVAVTIANTMTLQVDSTMCVPSAGFPYPCIATSSFTIDFNTAITYPYGALIIPVASSLNINVNPSWFSNRQQFVVGTSTCLNCVLTVAGTLSTTCDLSITQPFVFTPTSVVTTNGVGNLQFSAGGTFGSVLSVPFPVNITFLYVPYSWPNTYVISSTGGIAGMGTLMFGSPTIHPTSTIQLDPSASPSNPLLSLPNYQMYGGVLTTCQPSINTLYTYGGTPTVNLCTSFVNTTYPTPITIASVIHYNGVINFPALIPTTIVSAIFSGCGATSYFGFGTASAITSLSMIPSAGCGTSLMVGFQPSSVLTSNQVASVILTNCLIITQINIVNNPNTQSNIALTSLTITNVAVTVLSMLTIDVDAGCTPSTCLANSFQIFIFGANTALTVAPTATVNVGARSILAKQPATINLGAGSGYALTCPTCPISIAGTMNAYGATNVYSYSPFTFTPTSTLNLGINTTASFAANAQSSNANYLFTQSVNFQPGSNVSLGGLNTINFQGGSTIGANLTTTSTQQTIVFSGFATNQLLTGYSISGVGTLQLQQGASLVTAAGASLNMKTYQTTSSGALTISSSPVDSVTVTTGTLNLSPPAGTIMYVNNLIIAGGVVNLNGVVVINTMSVSCSATVNVGPLTQISALLLVPACYNSVLLFSTAPSSGIPLVQVTNISVTILQSTGTVGSSYTFGNLETQGIAFNVTGNFSVNIDPRCTPTFQTTNPCGAPTLSASSSPPSFYASFDVSPTTSSTLLSQITFTSTSHITIPAPIITTYATLQPTITFGKVCAFYTSCRPTVFSGLIEAYSPLDLASSAVFGTTAALLLHQSPVATSYMTIITSSTTVNLQFASALIVTVSFDNGLQPAFNDSYIILNWPSSTMTSVLTSSLSATSFAIQPFVYSSSTPLNASQIAVYTGMMSLSGTAFQMRVTGKFVQPPVPDVLTVVMDENTRYVAVLSGYDPQKNYPLTATIVSPLPDPNVCLLYVVPANSHTTIRISSSQQITPARLPLFMPARTILVLPARHYFGATCSVNFTLTNSLNVTSTTFGNITFAVQQVDEPPYAYSQSLSILPNTNFAVITLTGFAFNPAQNVSFYVTSMPRGSLFQYQSSSSTVIGAAITLIPGWITDALNRVVYIPSPTDISTGNGSPDTFQVRSDTGVFSSDVAALITITALTNITCPPGNYPSGTTCAQCAAGTFSAIPLRGTNASCTPCPAGFVQPSVGSTNCIGCTVGYYAQDPALTACHFAEPGTFVNVSNATTTQPCSVGTYSSGVATHCTTCQIGSFADTAHQSVCQACGAGLFNNQTGQSACSPCWPGTYAVSNATACSLCAVGRYTPSPTQSSCGVCPYGSYTILQGQSSCGACAAGTATPLDPAYNGTYCVPCQPGTFSSLSASICTLCQAGTYSSSNATQCTNCPSGRFSALPGSSTCLACGAGTFSVNGSSTCSLCDPGTYTNATASITCSPCAAGSAATLSGSVGCTMCSKGYYSSMTSASSCLQCDHNTYSGEGATSCNGCPNSDTGLVCVSGVLTNANNYWLAPSGLAAYACPDGFCTLSGGCAANRDAAATNPLCGRCAPDYVDWGGTCVYCKETNQPYVALAVVGSFAWVFIFYFVTSQPSADADASVRVFSFFTQNVMILLGPLQNWTQWLQFFNFRFQQSSSGACFAPMSSISAMLFNLAVPLIFAAELAIFMLLHFCVWYWISKRNPAAALASPASSSGGGAPTHDVAAKSSSTDAVASSSTASTPVLMGAPRRLDRLSDPSNNSSLPSSAGAVFGMEQSSSSSALDHGTVMMSVRDNTNSHGSLIALNTTSASSVDTNDGAVPAVASNRSSSSSSSSGGGDFLVVPSAARDDRSSVSSTSPSVCLEASAPAAGASSSSKLSFSVFRRLFPLHTRTFPVNCYIRTYIAMYLFSYTSISDIVIKYLQCEDVELDRVVASVPSISCNSTVYKQWLTIIILLLIFHVLATPVYIGLFLHRHHKQQQEKQRLNVGLRRMKQEEVADARSMVELERSPSNFKSSSSSSSLASSPSLAASSSSSSSSPSISPSPLPSAAAAYPGSVEFYERYGILYETYTTSRYWYAEAMYTSRRVLLIIVLVVFFQTPLYQKTVYTWFVLLFLMLHVYLQPYRSLFDNRLETATLCLLCCVAVLMTGQQGTGTLDVAAQVLLIFLVILPVIVMIGIVVDAKFKKSPELQLMKTKVGEQLNSAATKLKQKVVTTMAAISKERGGTAGGAGGESASAASGNAKDRTDAGDTQSADRHYHKHDNNNNNNNNDNNINNNNSNNNINININNDIEVNSHCKNKSENGVAAGDASSFPDGAASTAALHSNEAGNIGAASSSSSSSSSSCSPAVAANAASTSSSSSSSSSSGETGERGEGVQTTKERELELTEM